jgi:hypothetical protein
MGFALDKDAKGTAGSSGAFWNGKSVSFVLETCRLRYDSLCCKENPSFARLVNISWAVVHFRTIAPSTADFAMVNLTPVPLREQEPCLLFCGQKTPHELAGKTSDSAHVARAPAFANIF